MLSSCIISDDIEVIFDINDDNHINTEIQQKNLKKELLNSIYTDSISDNNNLMEPTSESDSKSKEVIDQDYLEYKEQINEVKINIYYILSLDCRLFIDMYYKYYHFIDKKKYVRTKRLIVQPFFIDNKKRVIMLA